ncbi:MAG: hypothetical protein WEA58_07810 [Balneolaceae bacterium]
MIRRFRLINDNEQEVARVIYFYEESIKKFVGILFESFNLSNATIRQYEDDNPNIIIDGLASNHGIFFTDFIEI